MYYGLNRSLKQLFRKPLAHPHLLVSGAQDHLFLYAAKAYAKFHPKWTELHIVPHCGHVVSIEQAAIFNQLCQQFLLGMRQDLSVNEN
jgi:pimeloyl-ACP methyl ester carboxylesterase